jgi:hypothetical protein
MDHSDVTQLSDSLRTLKARLHSRRASLRAAGRGSLQKRAVAALASIADRLLSEQCPLANDPNLFSGQVEAAWISLQATLACWTQQELWSLIDAEGARSPTRGPAVALHILAGNTALLAWSSLARALLVEAASIIRIPRGSPEVAAWTRLFTSRLNAADPELAGLVALAFWSSSDLSTTSEHCSIADIVLVYGSDETVAQIAGVSPKPVRFVGYGNRISFGMIMEDADLDRAAAGTALDMTIFDQQGCLSPQMVFVEGAADRASRFCILLADHLAGMKHLIPGRTQDDAAAIRDAAALTRFEAGVVVHTDPSMRYTIVQHPQQPERIPLARGVVHVIESRSWLDSLQVIRELGLAGSIQGVSLGAPNFEVACKKMRELDDFWVGYVCEPGRLQTPPFGWRENCLPVLRSFFAN